MAGVRVIPVWLLVVTLGGCGQTFGPGYRPGEAILPPDVMASRNIAGCGADDLPGIHGMHFTTLAEVRLRGQLRVLRPGQGLTRDLLPDRLNVQVDEGGTVLRMFCG